MKIGEGELCKPDPGIREGRFDFLFPAEKDLRSSEGELQRTRARLETLVAELQELAERLAEAEGEQSTARADLETAREEQHVVEGDVEDAQRDSDTRREELEARRQVATDRKIHVARAKEKTRGIEGALERLSRSANELIERARA